MQLLGRIWGAARGLSVMAAAGVAAAAPASPEFIEPVVAKYKVADNSPFAEKSCAACHVSDSDFTLNSYGKMLRVKMTETNQKALTEDVLAAVESLDADGDGKSNLEELQAGGLPGDPEGAAAAAVPEGGPSAEKPKASFPPKNGWHPAIVHFPIALLIAGLLLDLVGLLRKDANLLLAGWYNLVMGAVTALGGIASGFLAMTIMKLPYKGLIFEHMLYGIGVTIVMWIMVSLRVHRHEQMNLPARALYYVLAAAAFGMVSWAGHLGGVFVYGE